MDAFREVQNSLEAKKMEWKLKFLGATRHYTRIVAVFKHKQGMSDKERRYLEEREEVMKEIADYEQEHNLSLGEFKNELNMAANEASFQILTEEGGLTLGNIEESWRNLIEGKNASNQVSHPIVKTRKTVREYLSHLLPWTWFKK